MPAYPDGILVRGASEELFLITNGQRRALSNFTGEAAPAPAGALQLPDSELANIPQGPPLELAIEAEREDEVASDMPRRYMWTHVTLSQEAARIDGATRTWTRQPWFGYTGGVFVLLVSGNGEYVANTDLIQYGVDGFRVPFKRSDRQDYWAQSIAADAAARTVSLEIVHLHAPRERVFTALNDILAATRIMAEIVAQVRQVTG